MFSKLQLKSKIVIVVSFVFLSSVLGFGVFSILNTLFPKQVQAVNDETPLFDDKNKDEEVEDKEKDFIEVTQQDVIKSESDSMNIPRLKNKDMDFYISNTYRVGFDIEAGVYKVIVQEGSANGQYTISEKDKSDVSFYDGKLFFNFRYVELKEGETIYLIDADIVSDVNTQRYSKSEYVSGQYKVGFDIQPGSYKLVPVGQAGYVEISSTPLGEVLFSRYVETSVELELKEGQYVTISGVTVMN